MTDSPRQSMFDNRYRYDYIYPRGRSGETLRAWDTRDNDRPVVVKRPAPQDAPPMRAAQEVSIQTERKALERLSGHPVLAGLRGHGSFRVGGQTHAYIVLERAYGEIIGDVVLDLAETNNERLPLLETLNIVDELLDLLMRAHDEQVVYNDVDAKHLFWDRDNYKLTVIDWGNAVLLDEGNTSGVNRQTDIYQVGELLYFILTGGTRLDSETDVDGQYRVNFGDDMLTIPTVLQNLITQATHPNTRKRYSTLSELRRDLASSRENYLQQRDGLLDEIDKSLQKPLSRHELEELTTQIKKALAMDPGFPRSRALQGRIQGQHKRLALEADIDVAKIYLENANWARAKELMLDLREKADDMSLPLIDFIVATAELMAQRQRQAAPPTLAPALDALLQGDALKAGQRLMAEVGGNQPDDDQFLLADRMSALIPEVRFLHPPLRSLQAKLENLPNADKSLARLAKINDVLTAQATRRLQDLITCYQTTEQELNDLHVLLDKLTQENNLGYDALLDPLGRAQSAAQAVRQHLEVASRHVYGNPNQAGTAIRSAQSIDGINPDLPALNEYFNEIHEAIAQVDGFVPSKTGNNLSDWFGQVVSSLQPYGDDLEDRSFHQTLVAIEKSAKLWASTQLTLILGQRIASQENLQKMARYLADFNPQVSEWFKNLARQVEDTTHVERLSLNDKLAQRLIESYQLWDQGKFDQVVDYMEQISDYAHTDGEHFARERLGRLGEIAHTWITEGGAGSIELTHEADQEIFSLLLPEELTYHDKFIADTRDSDDLYLKMMERGLIAWMRNSSSAASRILFAHYVWQGHAAAQEDDFTNADFWREAALKANPNARTHKLFAEFDHFLTGRRLVVEVEAALQEIDDPSDLAQIRELLNQPMAEKWLGELQSAVRQLETGLTAWQDGNFQEAEYTTDQALRKLRDTQDNFRIDVNNFINWVQPLAHGAKELHKRRREIDRISMSGKPSPDGTPEAPDAALIEHFAVIVQTTEDLLGKDYSHQLRQWLSTYEDIRETHESDLNRNEKKIAFDAHFNNLFIDKHPAYALFKVWQQTAQNLPEPLEYLKVSEATTPEDMSREVEETIEQAEQPAPQAAPSSSGRAKQVATSPAATQPESEAYTVASEYTDDYDDFVRRDVGDDIVSEAVMFEDEPNPSGVPWTVLVTVGVVIVGLIAFALMFGIGGGGDEDDATATTASNNTVVSGNGGATEVPTDIPPTTAVETTTAPTNTPNEDNATNTVEPSPRATEEATPTDAPPTATFTPELPTATPEPPTDTPVPSTPTPPPFTGLPQNILPQLTQLLNSNEDAIPWDTQWFDVGAGGVWQLGTTKAIAGDAPILVRITPEFLESVLGPQAGERVVSVEAQLRLTNYDPNDISAGVYFGFGVENSSRERTAVEITIVEANPLIGNVQFMENTTALVEREIPFSEINVPIRWEITNTGTVQMYFQNGLVGESEINYAGDSLTTILYTSGGGVFVAVSELKYEVKPLGSQ